MILLTANDTIDFPGDYSEGETPDPIPNSAVKPFSVDDTTIGGKVEHRQGFFLPFLHTQSQLTDIKLKKCLLTIRTKSLCKKGSVVLNKNYSKVYFPHFPNISK